MTIKVQNAITVNINTVHCSTTPPQCINQYHTMISGHCQKKVIINIIGVYMKTHCTKTPNKL